MPALGQQQTLRPLSKAWEIVVGSIPSWQRDVPVSNELNGTSVPRAGEQSGRIEPLRGRLASVLKKSAQCSQHIGQRNRVLVGRRPPHSAQ